MKIKLVDLGKQNLFLKREINKAINKVINGAAFIGTKSNRFITEFESSFAEYLGISYCITCGNGTDAIEIALRALNVGSGDEVIVPSHTWISTAEAVLNAGAKPVFVDTLYDYYTIDPEKIESKITKKTKAIIPVHLYGLPAKMHEIMKVARKHKLKIIEDCAQAHGAEYDGRKAGTYGDISTFSFFPSKNLGAYGDAGCVVTNSRSLAESARLISNHGQNVKNTHLVCGRNSRMDGIQASILKVKLKYLDDWNEERIKLSELYKLYLSDSGHIKCPAAYKYAKHVYHLYVIQTGERDLYRNKLNQNGIETNIHYPRILPLLKPFKKNSGRIKDYANSLEYQERIISLPMYPGLEINKLKKVCKVLRDK